MKNAKSGCGWKFSVIHRVTMFLAIFTVLISGLSVSSVRASNPKSGSLDSTTGATTTWVGDAPGGASNDETTCQDNPANMPSYSPGVNCDVFTLTLTAGDYTNKRLQIALNWMTIATDYDLVVRRESGANPGLQVGEDTVVTTSGNGTTNFEEASITPGATGNEIYYVRAIYFAATAGDQYRGTASIAEVSSNALVEGACALPTFDNYQPPSTLTNSGNSGEPSIGVNWNSGNVMVQARIFSFRASFNDSTSPADPNKVQWYQTRSGPATRTGFDPILFTDSITGRTIGGELVVAAGTTSALISDDDLTTSTQAFLTGGPQQGFDHQTIGGGPPRRDTSGLTDTQAGVINARQPTTDYPHLFYYASQQIAYGSVATSFDGGLTASAVLAYDLTECGGLHGHIKVAPDGTVYLPNKNCQNKAAVVVSEDNGLTWEVRKIPTSSVGRDDPSVGIGAGGKIYVAYTDASLHPHVAVSDDRGKTFPIDIDLSAGLKDSAGNPLNLRAAVFPSLTAGDNNRAGLFFLATDSTSVGDPTGTDGASATGEDPNAADNFKGTWYPYVAMTCDGGKTWSVVRADNDPRRPGQKNPVQQGVICKNGTTCPDDNTNDTRNLLDFNDATVDSRGRLLGAYADGCITETCRNRADNSVDRTGNDSSAYMTVIRQRGGTRLFAEFDSAGAAAPPISPPVSAFAAKRGNMLAWTTPDDNNSPILSYRVYRGARGKGETMIAEVGDQTFSFNDRVKRRIGQSGTYYRVTAVNAYGESPRNVKSFPSEESR